MRRTCASDEIHAGSSKLQEKIQMLILKLNFFREGEDEIMIVNDLNERKNEVAKERVSQSVSEVK